MLSCTVFLFIIFAFVIIVLCILYYFYVLVTNFSLLFLPCILLKNNNSSSYELDYANDLSKAERSLPLKAEKVYPNLAKKDNLDLIKQELSGLAGLYSFKYNVTGKMYIASSINI